MTLLLRKRQLSSDIMFLVVILQTIFAFQTVVAQSEKNDLKESFSSDEKVYQIADSMPEFNGGKEALNNYFAHRLNQPAEQQDGMIKASVYLSLIIEKDGTTSNERIIKGISPSVDSSTLQALKNMPLWNPGMKNNIPVRVAMVIQVEHWIDENDLPTKSKTRETPAISGNYNEAALVSPNVTYDPSSGDDMVFTIVEKSPQFPGGETARMAYLSNNLKYPSEAGNKGIQGTVYITYIIEKDGSVSDVRVLRGVHPALDKEAVRVTESMPVWQPGKQRGKPVRVRINTPVKFTIK